MSDIVDSTQVHEAIGEEAGGSLWAEHDRSARHLIREWRGREIGRSDGFLLLFADCDDALGFAFAYHRMTACLTTPMLARVGIHWGQVSLRLNSPEDMATGATPFELDGLALPTAARVMGAALGRQTLLSAPAARALMQSVPYESKSCGFWQFKGLLEPVELLEAAPPGVALLGPPGDSTKAYRVLRSRDFWQPIREVPNNLGPEPDTFIGRVDDVLALVRAFDSGTRLITVAGPGGVGKTRLALRYGRAWLGAHPQGAWFCDLSSARTIDGILYALSQALEVPLGRQDPIQHLGTALAGRGDCLVVMDNFEQVRRYADLTVGRWLAMAPQCRFVVTSREVLGLQGEHLHLLEPLSATEAYDLFVSRMQAAAAPRTAADEAALPDLVDLLDHLPLAIELAAARSRLIPPALQASRIGERFRFLSRAGRQDRQGALRATLDWSWDLLSLPERLALAQLSVFEGGFSLPAAEAVLDLSRSGCEAWAADVLQSLLDKSLIRTFHQHRLGLLKAVKDYAAERLHEFNINAAERHWNYFAGLSENAAVLDRCAELENIVAACRGATAHAIRNPSDERSLEAAVQNLANSWAGLRLAGPFRVAVELGEPLIGHAALTVAQRARVCKVMGGAHWLSGQTDRAAQQFAASLEMAVRADLPTLRAQLHAQLADMHVLAGRSAAATSEIEAAERLVGDDAQALLTTLNARGNLAVALGDAELALASYSRALALAEQVGDRRWQGGMHGSLGAAAMTRGDRASARMHLERARELADEVGNRQWAGSARCNLGLLLAEMGDQTAGAQQLRDALELARSTGFRRLEAVVCCNQGIVRMLQGQPALAIEAFDAALKLSRALAITSMETRCLGYLGEATAAHGQGRLSRHHFSTARGLSTQTDKASRLLVAIKRIAALAWLGRVTRAAHFIEQLGKLHAAELAAEADLSSARDAALQVIRRRD